VNRPTDSCSVLDQPNSGHFSAAGLDDVADAVGSTQRKNHGGGKAPRVVNSRVFDKHIDPLVKHRRIDSLFLRAAYLDTAFWSSYGQL